MRHHETQPGHQVATRVRRTAACLPALLILAACAPADLPLTAETVLQRHAEARGGADHWAAVESLKIEGTWTGFSADVPMTIWRMRPGLYRIDHALFDAPATFAYDGEHVWLASATFGAPDGQELTDEWRRNILLDAPFGPQLLAHSAAGAAIEYLGVENVEGADCHVLRVVPQDSPEETWYLDAETFLETKRVSKTFDVFSGPGIEPDMETYYLDFREVGGVVIPYREERHFSIRYNVLEAASIEVNPGIDAAIFAMPPGAAAPEGEAS